MKASPGGPAALFDRGRGSAPAVNLGRVCLSAGLTLLLVCGGCFRQADARRKEARAGQVIAADAGTRDGRAAMAATAPRGALAPAPAAAGAPTQAAAPTKPILLGVDQVAGQMRKARGKPLFVHLWATWCFPCLDELPLIERFAANARARGASFLSLSLDSDAGGIERVPQVLQRLAPGLAPNVAVFPDPERFMALLSPDWEGAIPALFAFDRKGKLQGSLIGEVEAAELDALLEQLGAGSAARNSGAAAARP